MEEPLCQLTANHCRPDCCSAFMLRERHLIRSPGWSGWKVQGQSPLMIQGRRPPVPRGNISEENNFRGLGSSAKLSHRRGRDCAGWLLWSLPPRGLWALKPAAASPQYSDPAGAWLEGVPVPAAEQGRLALTSVPMSSFPSGPVFGATSKRIFLACFSLTATTCVLKALLMLTV